MFALLACFSLSTKYPLLIGTPNGEIKDIASLEDGTNYPNDFCIFIIQQNELPPIKDFRKLMQWGNSKLRCQETGYFIPFPGIESETFNIVEKFQQHYKHALHVDTRSECPCKLRYYEGGLVIVRIADNEESIVQEVLQDLPSKISIAFVAQNGNLFEASEEEF